MIRLIRKSKLHEMELKIEDLQLEVFELEMDVDNHMSVYKMLLEQLDNSRAEIESLKESTTVMEEVVRDSIAYVKSRKS